MVGHFSRVTELDFQLLNRPPQSEVENRLGILTDQLDAEAQCGAIKGAAGAKMKHTNVARACSSPRAVWHDFPVARSISPNPNSKVRGP